MQILFFIIALLVFPALSQAQETSGDFVGGSIVLGDDVRSCTGAIEGSIRYQSNKVQICNGTTWYTTSSSWYTGITYTSNGVYSGCAAVTSTALTNDLTGHLSSDWGSQSTGANEWLQADLGSSKTVDRIGYGGLTCSSWSANCSSWWNGTAGSASGGDTKLQHSNDASTWTTISTLPKNYEDNVIKKFYFTPVTARYFRLKGENGHWTCTGQFKIGTAL